MIVADTSAIIAIVFAEPEREAFIDAACAAFVAFGKGSGHPAALNFGDVFGYALAKVRGLPLLNKGSDFSETDLASALVQVRRAAGNIETAALDLVVRAAKGK